MGAVSLDEPRGRAMCGRCRRPQIVCYCAALPTLETTTKIVILQHPRERDMPIGTARMASLCLPHAELHVGLRWDDHARLAHALADPARPPILLYPGPGARDILREPPPGPVTLVVVDGTWSQAKTVVRDNPILHALPRYAFETPEPSHYRIRREPRAEYVSTIEALMHVLGALEGEPARFRALLDPLRAMVDAQLACQAREGRRRVRVPRGPRPVRRPLPDDVMRRFDDLVCVVAEANAWPFSAGTDSPRDELVHLVAFRPRDGALFDMVAAPERPLSPTTSFHTELDEATLLAGISRAELFARFAAFTQASDIACAWGHYGLSLVTGAGGTLPGDPVDLRAAAQRFTNKKIGAVEDFARAFAPAPRPMTAGRAGRRLAMLAQIVDGWRAYADAAAPA
jgi:DTW domain-containing protein